MVGTMGGFFGCAATKACNKELFYGTDYLSHLGTKRGGLVTKKQTVDYTAWWMSETPEGRLFMTWLSIRRSDPTFTLEDADDIFREHMEELEMIADEVGEISSPELGNSAAPPSLDGPTGAKPETARQRRKRRKRRRQTGH